LDVGGETGGDELGAVSGGGQRGGQVAGGGEESVAGEAGVVGGLEGGVQPQGSLGDGARAQRVLQGQRAARRRRADDGDIAGVPAAERQGGRGGRLAVGQRADQDGRPVRQLVQGARPVG